MLHEADFQSLKMYVFNVSGANDSHVTHTNIIHTKNCSMVVLILEVYLLLNRSSNVQKQKATASCSSNNHDHHRIFFELFLYFVSSTFICANLVAIL